MVLGRFCAHVVGRIIGETSKNEYTALPCELLNKINKVNSYFGYTSECTNRKEMKMNNRRPHITKEYGCTDYRGERSSVVKYLGIPKLKITSGDE